MGFFSKIKQNIQHGGVKVQLQAPASVSMEDPTIPVRVSVTASDSQVSIKNVQVEIIKESRNMAFSTGGNNSQPTSTRQTVAHVENNEAFSLMPGESKSVSLNIVMNEGTALEEQLPQGGGMAQVAYALGQLQTAAENLNPHEYNYSVEAVANVDGVVIDPSDTRPIQILKAGEFGTATNYQVKL